MKIYFALLLVLWTFPWASSCAEEEECKGILPIEMEILWSGFYEDTYMFFNSLNREEIGPAAEVENGVMQVEWRAMVYEDCREPDGIRCEQSGQDIFFSIEDLVSGEVVCGHSDYVADVSTSRYFSPGKYTIHVECKVHGLGYQNRQQESFEVEVE